MSLNLVKAESVNPEKLRAVFDIPPDPDEVIDPSKWWAKWHKPVCDWSDLFMPQPLIELDPNDNRAVFIQTKVQPAENVLIGVEGLTGAQGEPLGNKTVSFRGMHPLELWRDTGTVGEWLRVKRRIPDIQGVQLKLPDGTTFDFTQDATDPDWFELNTSVVLPHLSELPPGGEQTTWQIWDILPIPAPGSEGKFPILPLPLPIPIYPPWKGSVFPWEIDPWFDITDAILNRSRPRASEFFLTDQIDISLPVADLSTIIGVEGKVLVRGDPNNAVPYLSYDPTKPPAERLPPGVTIPTRPKGELTPYPWYAWERRPCWPEPTPAFHLPWKPDLPPPVTPILPPINPNSDGLNLPEGLHTLQLTFHNIGALSSTIDIPLELMAPIEKPEIIRANEILKVRRLIPHISGINLEVNGFSRPMGQNPVDSDLFELDLSTLPLAFPPDEEGSDDPYLEGFLRLISALPDKPMPFPPTLLITPALSLNTADISIRDVDGNIASEISPSRLYEIAVSVFSSEKISGVQIGVSYKDKNQNPHWEQVGEISQKKPQNSKSGSIWVSGSELLKHYGRAGATNQNISARAVTPDGKQMEPEGGSAIAPPRATPKTFDQALSDAISAYVDQDLPYSWGKKKTADELKKKNEGITDRNKKKGTDCSGFAKNVIDSALLDSGHEKFSDLLLEYEQNRIRKYNERQTDPKKMLRVPEFIEVHSSAFKGEKEGALEQVGEEGKGGEVLWKDLQPGDVLYKKGHVMVVEKNEIKNGKREVTLADSSDKKENKGPARTKVVVDETHIDTAKIKDTEGVTFENDTAKNKITETENVTRPVKKKREE